jgi:hypothetical protein
MAIRHLQNLIDKTKGRVLADPPFFFSYLYNPGGFERFIRAVFGNCAHTLSREKDRNSTVKLRHKNTLLLEVSLFANSASRVEFGSTNTVGVASCDFGAPLCDWTNLCHIGLEAHMIS